MQSEVAAVIGLFFRVFYTERKCDKGLAHLIENFDQLVWLAHGVKYEFDEHDYPELSSIDGQSSVRIADQWLNGMHHTNEKSDLKATIALIKFSR